MKSSLITPRSLNSFQIGTPPLLIFLFLLLILSGCSTLAESRPADGGGWAEPVRLAESENFFRVTPDLYRAAQPSSRAMKAYAAFGIKTVINLRGFHSDRDEVRGTGLKLEEIPIHTWAAGEDDNVIQALQAIRDAEKPVLVHCQHGADRTGLIIAMYRIVEQGWSKLEALEEMRRGGFGFHPIWENIPEYIEEAETEKIRQALR